MKWYSGILFFLFTACHTITTGDKLNETDIQLIQQLGLVDKNEPIIKFYSQYQNNLAGNFFTEKRVSAYWLDKHRKEETQINTAYYPDIISMDTVYYAGSTYSPYMLIMRKDSSSFKLYFDGEKNELKETFEEVLKLWKNSH